jgi:hypothetical protein
MNLLHSGVDLATIALWLGHTTTKATGIHVNADLALKEQALARTAGHRPTPLPAHRRRPGIPPNAVVMPTHPARSPPPTRAQTPTPQPNPA